MKIAFIGYGSIARRHIKNLFEILKKREVNFTIDVFRHSEIVNERDSIIDKYVSNVYREKDLEKFSYDIIFITNPTAFHLTTMERCAKLSKYLFIEKPICNRTDMPISQTCLDNRSRYYVACPLRYMAVLQYLKEKISLNDVYSVRAISSSFLHDWRPGVDYRKTYSADKKLGGGVSIDLIHEWDYLTYFFGFPQNVCKFEKKVSNLEITSDDLAVYIGEYKDKIIELHLDYFGRKVIRELMLFTREDTITIDLIENKIVFEKQGKEIVLHDDRDSFQKRELCHFLDIVDGKIENDNDICNAMKVLKIAK